MKFTTKIAFLSLIPALSFAGVQKFSDFVSKDMPAKIEATFKNVDWDKVQAQGSLFLGQRGLAATRLGAFCALPQIAKMVQEPKKANYLTRKLDNEAAGYGLAVWTAFMTYHNPAAGFVHAAIVEAQDSLEKTHPKTSKLLTMADMGVMAYAADGMLRDNTCYYPLLGTALVGTLVGCGSYMAWLLAQQFATEQQKALSNLADEKIQTASQLTGAKLQAGQAMARAEWDGTYRPQLEKIVQDGLAQAADSAQGIVSGITSTLSPVNVATNVATGAAGRVIDAVTAIGSLPQAAVVAVQEYARRTAFNAVSRAQLTDSDGLTVHALEASEGIDSIPSDSDSDSENYASTDPEDIQAVFVTSQGEHELSPVASSSFLSQPGLRHGFHNASLLGARSETPRSTSPRSGLSSDNMQESARQ